MILKILLRLGPDLGMALIFIFAWAAPHVRGAAAPGDGRTIMILEGLSIAAAALVGVYFRAAYVFFPLAVLGCLAWLAMTVSTGWSWAMIGFAWFILSAFLDNIAAHRGKFGMARENPDHPHRRYDRMFLLYLFTAPVLPAAKFTGIAPAWIAWGAVYFVLLAAADSVLRSPFDRIPKAILKALKAWAGPDVKTRLGLCADCAYVQPAVPPTRQRPVRCALSATDARFAEYPAVPISACEGFRPPREGD